MFGHTVTRPRAVPVPGDGYAISVGLMTPASRGSLRLASADPSAAPLIDPAYLTEQRGLDRLVTGLRLAREIGAGRALTDWRDEEISPGPSLQSEDDLRDYVRRSVSTCFHLTGTCGMGTGEMAVVDPRLRVRGVEGLRVADASVMPFDRLGEHQRHGPGHRRARGGLAHATVHLKSEGAHHMDVFLE